MNKVNTNAVQKTSILEQIVANKKIEIQAGKYKPPEHLLVKSTRSFKQSIIDNLPGLILECKAASPSRGQLVENYDPVSLALSYQPYAAAISVLTDEKYFQGSLEHLKAVSKAVDLPVLCKDFFICDEQVKTARFHGADAILLMLSVIDDATYKDLSEVAHSLGLDVLTEVHDEQELNRALTLNAQIIGINNRNLKTLSIDLNNTKNLSRLIPDDVLVISESGFSKRNQLLEMKNLSRPVNGFLIGSHLSSSTELDTALKALKFGKVKICGLTSNFDAQVALGAGASFGGLIFAKSSPRCINIDSARLMVERVPLNWVGVFTETSVDEIVEISSLLSLNAIQLHWDANSDFIDLLKSKIGADCEIWSVIKIDTIERGNSMQGNSNNILLSGKSNENVDRYLLEARGELDGGNGICFDWSVISQSKVNLDKVILAGGLTPENAKQAFASGVGMIDVNSGVENKPGQKCPIKIKALFENLASTGDV